MGVAERGAKDKTAWLVMSVEDISLGQYLPLRNVLSKKKKKPIHHLENTLLACTGAQINQTMQTPCSASRRP